MTKRVSIISVLSALILLGAAVPAVAAGGGGAPKDFAKTVCTSLTDWGSAINATIDDLQGAASVEEAADTAVQGVSDATDELVESLDSLERPSTKNGKKAQNAINDLGESLADTASSIEDTLSEPPSTPEQIAAVFASIGSDLQKAVSDVKSTARELESLDVDKELRTAFEQSSACQDLKDAL